MRSISGGKAIEKNTIDLPPKKINNTGLLGKLKSIFLKKGPSSESSLSKLGSGVEKKEKAIQKAQNHINQTGAKNLNRVGFNHIQSASSQRKIPIFSPPPPADDIGPPPPADLPPPPPAPADFPPPPPTRANSKTPQGNIGPPPPTDLPPPPPARANPAAPKDNIGPPRPGYIPAPPTKEDLIKSIREEHSRKITDALQLDNLQIHIDGKVTAENISLFKKLNIWKSELTILTDMIARTAVLDKKERPAEGSRSLNDLKQEMVDKYRKAAEWSWGGDNFTMEDINKAVNNLQSVLENISPEAPSKKHPYMKKH